MAGGMGGVPPQNLKRGRVAHLSNLPRVGPKTLANPQPTGVGKGGPGGRSPHGGGSWGVSPHKFKRGGELPTLATCPRWDPKRQRTLSPRGWAKLGGGGGRSPLPGGLGDVPPSFQIRGRVALSCNPATSGTHSAGEPSAHGGGQRVVQGAKPPWRGHGGCPPTKSKGGELPTLATCPRVGPKAPADP